MALAAVITALVVTVITVGLFSPDLALWLEWRSPTVVDGIEYTLIPDKRTYFVGEPFRFSLRACNVSDTSRVPPEDLDSSYRLKVLGAKELDVERHFAARLSPELKSLAPGEAETVRLSSVPFQAGRQVGIALWQYTFLDATPRWSTTPVRIRCVVQPLRFPPGTTGSVAGALAELYDSPMLDISPDVRPGVVEISYTDAMQKIKDLGRVAAEALVANVGNYRVQLSVLQLLGDLRVTAAVPQLVTMLSTGDKLDSFRDALVLTVLGRITEHPQGDSFSKRVFDLQARREAVAAYQAWWESHQSRASGATASS